MQDLNYFVFYAAHILLTSLFQYNFYYILTTYSFTVLQFYSFEKAKNSVN